MSLENAPQLCVCVLQEDQSNSANAEGSGWTIPAGVAVSGGPGWGALADAALSQGCLAEEDLAAAVAVSPSLRH